MFELGHPDGPGKPVSSDVPEARPKRRIAPFLALIALGVAVAIVGRMGASGSEEPLEGSIVRPDDLSGFKVQPGFKIELVACEPMVRSPVAMSFDEDGRLWVVEMGSFMNDLEATGEKSPVNRIVILEDTDGDGVMDKSTVFLDGLVLPRAVMPTHGGALVLEPPTLYFCPDRDHDGKADEKIPLLGGFGGLESPEHAANGLLRGLDNWVYFSQHPLRLKFDGKTLLTERTPEHGQWGITQDDAGRLYYAPNSDALRGDMYPKHYASRNPSLGGAAGVNETVCRDLTVWPTHPTAVNRGYQDKVLRKDGTLEKHTAACSPLIYRAELLGPEVYGNGFVCEPAGNLVKRMILNEGNGVVSAKPAYPDRDFLTSTDPRFRPVSLCTGPDGAIYIADMYRGVLQHKNFVTDYLREQTRAAKLERPLSQGRIYRIVPAAGLPKSPRPALSRESSEKLVGVLSRKDSWWRETAQKLLIERGDVSVQPALRELMHAAASPETRLHALWTLEGLGCATPEDALFAMKDTSAWVRCAGARVGEAWPQRADIVAAWAALVDDPNRLVRVQGTLSAGERKGSSNLLRVALQHHGSDPFVRSAVGAGLKGRELAFLDGLMESPKWPSTQQERDQLSMLADCVLRSDSAAAKAGLVERLATLAMSKDQRATLLMTSLTRAQRLDSQSPRTITLGSEPAGWAKLMAQAEHPMHKTVTESNWYLTWPGREPMNPPRKVRALTDKEQGQFDRGSFLYSDCTACHGQDGKGVAGQAPPLAGSARAQGPVTQLARILLQGFEGPIQREGVSYDGVMAPAPRSNDADLAALMTYVRRAWGNGADPVSEDMVRQVRMLTAKRNRPWRAEELETIK